MQGRTAASVNQLTHQVTIRDMCSFFSPHQCFLFLLNAVVNHSQQLLMCSSEGVVSALSNQLSFSHNLAFSDQTFNHVS